MELTGWLLTDVASARWIVWAHRNVRALGAAGLRTALVWAEGYLFIPIIDLGGRIPIDAPR